MGSRRIYVNYCAFFISAKRVTMLMRKTSPSKDAFYTRCIALVVSQINCDRMVDSAN